MDKQWHALMLHAMQEGEIRRDRTGVGTRALFGVHEEFDLREGFPACTTKKLGFRQVAAELAAFIQGAETLAEFNALGCTIWDANASAPAWKERQRFPGDVGRIYGAQWRRWRSCDPASLWNRAHEYKTADILEVDQLKRLVDGLRTDPHGRRHIVTCWNPGELQAMCLPPCHIGFQCFASDNADGHKHGHEGWIDLKFSMRSLDLFIGAPFDIASYALLAHLIGREVNRLPRKLIMEVGDAHVYGNHHEQVSIVLAREPMPLPGLALPSYTGSTMFGFLPGDADLIGYESHPAVPAPMNV